MDLIFHPFRQAIHIFCPWKKRWTSDCSMLRKCSSAHDLKQKLCPFNTQKYRYLCILRGKSFHFVSWANEHFSPSPFHKPWQLLVHIFFHWLSLPLSFLPSLSTPVSTPPPPPSINLSRSSSSSSFYHHYRDFRDVFVKICFPNESIIIFSGVGKLLTKGNMIKC